MFIQRKLRIVLIMATLSIVQHSQMKCTLIWISRICSFHTSSTRVKIQVHVFVHTHPLEWLAFCSIQIILTPGDRLNTVKCHCNACHYNANASLTRSILGSQTAPTCPHDHPRVAQHMGYRCEIIAVWSATAAMTPLCSHTNGIKQRYPTCWLCQYSRFMIDLRSNTLIIHLRCSENAINRPIWLPDARMLKTILVAIKLT